MLDAASGLPGGMSAETSAYRSTGNRLIARGVAVGAELFGVGVVGASIFMRGLFGGDSHAAGAPVAEEAIQDGATCTVCHEMTDGFTHPVNVTPSMRVPGVLPLRDGRVTCETCHDGDAARGHSSFAGTGKSFLRVPGETGLLCASCRGAGGRSPHASGLLARTWRSRTSGGRARGSTVRAVRAWGVTMV
jgi:hypothetical protein